MDIKALLPELKKQVNKLSEDLLARVTTEKEIKSSFVEVFEQIKKSERTAQAFEVWLEDYLDQVAVAWVLSCVFVRFLEDNELIEQTWLSGDKDRLKQAKNTHEEYFKINPFVSDREYFLHVFTEVGKIPAAKDLFAQGKTPLWAVGPSGDCARELLQFWQEVDPDTGYLKRKFVVPNDDTRFLGDLYQDLSERARKKYALLQTPDFVEEFILDRTLTPAIEEFGFKKVRMIDPTCGSGHFLLGSFSRLFELWIKEESNVIVAVQKALDGVFGVDLNPFAVAIARFRLIIAALHACGLKKLKQARQWKINLAVGDSLLFGSDLSWDGARNPIQHQQDFTEINPIYAVEDRSELQRILGQGYHAVVGNPPFINVKDKLMRKTYRKLYSACYRKYSLSVPFAQRFWQLGLHSSETKSGGGYIGQITANSFMKREFGKKLIEEFFPKIDLTHVMDTSGAYIPGHDTPTVILFGRNQKPLTDTVRAVLGIKGEPRPHPKANPSQGCVWQSILKHIDRTGEQDKFTSSTDIKRVTFGEHPWSIGGGGASDLKKTLEEIATTTLEICTEVIGVFGMTNADEIFLSEKRAISRNIVEPSLFKKIYNGEELRDWVFNNEVLSFYPYGDDEKLIDIAMFSGALKWIWPAKTCLGNRATFNQGTYFSEGLPWWKWHQVTPQRLRTPLSIAFAFIATHNHFVLDRGGKVFNRSVPIIKLPEGATEEDHLALLGLLNSSVACFWGRQSLFPKGGFADGKWEERLEWDGTKLNKFPVTEQKPLEIATQLDKLSQELGLLTPDALSATKTPNLDTLTKAKAKSLLIFQQMIALQEELDWQCYNYYKILDQDLTYTKDDLPEIALGERAFEIVMAKDMANGELETSWFERHGSNPITEIPSHWPKSYQKLVQQRIELIESHKEIGMIEKPEYKRRWSFEPWKEQEKRALKNWLLDRLESSSYWPDPAKIQPALQSTSQLADKASADNEFLEVATLYRGRNDFDVNELVAKLVTAESVPYLPVLRYKPEGLRKRKVWEDTWDLQRLEDAGKPVANNPVPPEYNAKDFLKPDYWRLRGKLDVPKERWISYPYCQTDADGSLVVAWAGWNHLQQATAIGTYYDKQKKDGWLQQRLVPLLAGLDQLIPWIKQWHPEIDAEFSDSAGQAYESLLETDVYKLGLTLEAVRDWKPSESKAPLKRKGKGK
jgi:hypothetical protein